MASERSLLEEEALQYHLAGQAAVMEEARKQKVELAPLSTPEGRWQRGLIDENEEATDEGRLFVDLMDAGLFDEGGNLTEKGKAFAMPRGEAELEQNLPLWTIREQHGLNEAPETSFGQDVEAVGGFVWDAVKGATSLWNQIATGRILFGSNEEQDAKDALIRQGFAEGAVEGPAQLGAGGNSLLEQGWAKLNDDERGYYAAKQKLARFNSSLEDLNAGEIYGGIINSQRAVDALNASRARAIQRLGPEVAKEIEAQGEAGGQLIGDPTNIATAGAGAVVGGAGKLPMIARIGAKAEQATMAALKAEQANLALARARMALGKAEQGARVAANGAERSLVLNKGLQGRAYQVAADRLGAEAATLRGSIPALEQAAADATAHSAKLAESAGGAQKVMAAIGQMQEFGRQVRAAPAKALGPALESIGEGVMRADSWVKANLQWLDQARTTAAALGVLTGAPSLAIPAAIRAAGPVIKGVGNFTRVLGDELMQARGTVPFWRRVAENSNASPISRATAHLFDTATLGGKLPATAGRVANGAAAAAPVNLMFETIATGGEPDVGRGLAGALVFGGGGALGGAMVKGRLNDLRARTAGDEINLRRSLSPEEGRRFSLMPAGARKAMAVYAGSFPGLKFRLTEDGPSSFDRSTNTATINTSGKDWLRPIVAHEVNHYLQIASQSEDGIRAMLVGEQGGLLRSKEGRLDPNFAAFRDAYNERARKGGQPELNIEDAAIEYFNEATVDSLLGDADSTKLQRRAQRSAGERMMVNLIETAIGKTPLLRDLFYRTGGATDGAGRMVQGNGLLGDGVRELPGAKAMVRKMMRDTAGKKVATKQAAPETPAVKIDAKDSTAADAMFSIFETDSEGKVLRDKDGHPTIIKPETEKARAEMGKEIAKAIDTEENAALGGKDDGEPLDVTDPVVKEEAQTETQEQKSRRVKRTTKGDHEGTHFSPKAMQAARKSGKLNKLQMAVLRMLNRAARDMDGSTYSVMYHPAIKRDQFGKNLRYASIEASLRDVIPMGFKVTKKGNVVVSLLELNQLAKNIEKRAASDTGRALYAGSEMSIRADLEAVIDLHRANQKTDAYFQGKYGPRWQSYKNFINSILSTKTKDQAAANPVYATEAADVGSPFKSFRIDRISKTVKSRDGKPMPVGPQNYENAKINYLPEPVEP